MPPQNMPCPVGKLILHVSSFYAALLPDGMPLQHAAFYVHHSIRTPLHAPLYMHPLDAHPSLCNFLHTCTCAPLRMHPRHSVRTRCRGRVEAYILYGPVGAIKRGDTHAISMRNQHMQSACAQSACAISMCNQHAQSAYAISMCVISICNQHVQSACAISMCNQHVQSA